MSKLKTKIAYNVVSTAIPLAVGLVVTPYLIRAIGVEKFGILTMAWMVVGYFGILDMGLGRALTQKVAERIGRNATKNLKSIVWITTLTATILGLVGAALILVSSEWLAYKFLNVSPGIGPQLKRGFIWIAATIPLVLASTSLTGVLEGQQNFGISGGLRALISTLTFCAPVVSASYSTDLDVIFFSLFAVRFCSLAATALIVLRSTKKYAGWAIESKEFRSLFQYGGWVTLSNIISPLMVYFDRFYIASALSASVVAYYTTPADLISKLLYLPLALTGVMFASFATDWEAHRETVRRRYRKTLFAIAAMMLPAPLIALFFGEKLLVLWLGVSFAAQSYQIMQILSLGLLFNALATVPFAYIQATGRADVTAKFHMLELPVYIGLIYLFTNQYGLVGVAMAWTTRTFVDMSLLIIFARRHLG